MSNTTTRQLDNGLANGGIAGQHSPRGRTKRSQYVVSRQAQTRMAAELVLLWLVGAFLAVINLYVLHKFGDLYWNDMLQADDSNWMEKLVPWTYTAISLTIAIVVFLLACIYYSHRIAGPAYKLSNCLEDIGDGDLRIRVQLRTSDYLKDVADAVNGVTLKFHNTLSSIQESVQSMKDSAERDNAEDLLRHCKVIEQILDKYKFKGG